MVYEKEKKEKTSPTTDIKAPLFSDNTDEDYYEARLSAQIKKNEQLMVHLQIPGNLVFMCNFIFLISVLAALIHKVICSYL